MRVDTAITEAGEVSLHYDPMIAKISCWAPTRAEAIARMRVALDETRVEPPKKGDGARVGSLRTNLEFLRRLSRNEDVLAGSTATDLIAKNKDLTELPSSAIPPEMAVALSLHQLLQQSAGVSAILSDRRVSSSNWKLASRQEGTRR